jgi:hypothetical protein
MTTTCGYKTPRAILTPQVFIKRGIPLRLTVSNIGALTYQFSKYLVGIIIPLLGSSKHHVKICIEFLYTFGSVGIGPEDRFVSCGVVSVFTRVPFVESLNPFGA